MAGSSWPLGGVGFEPFALLELDGVVIRLDQQHAIFDPRVYDGASLLLGAVDVLLHDFPSRALVGQNTWV
jgi:hypothetical protein